MNSVHVHIIQDTPLILHNITGEHIFQIHMSGVTGYVYIFLLHMSGADLTIICQFLQRGTKLIVKIIHIQKCDEQLNLTTRQEHTMVDCTSSVEVKGALYDQARFTYKGKIAIFPEASMTQAYQKSHTLLLSDKACAQATPSLEVQTQQVQCKHGSAIAAIDKECIEYLTSRGLASDDAQKIVVESFFKQIFEHDEVKKFYTLIQKSKVE